MNCCPIVGFDSFSASIQPGTGNIVGKSRIVTPGTHWELDTFSAMIFLGGAGSAVTEIFSAGLYLCPPGMNQDEAGWGAARYATALCMDSTSFQTIGTAAFLTGPMKATRFVYNGRGVIVPENWFLLVQYPNSGGGASFDPVSFGVGLYSYKIIEHEAAA